MPIGDIHITEKHFSDKTYNLKLSVYVTEDRAIDAQFRITEGRKPDLLLNSRADDAVVVIQSLDLYHKVLARPNN